ncbi:BamA/TamA family outer membrane protein [bacterium]|nr:BamA/TamA family outer membrane protein [FCB group bacterium]MBL7191043.1 BamA/TamA family outer membrane protein [bacterium]
MKSYRLFFNPLLILLMFFIALLESRREVLAESNPIVNRILIVGNEVTKEYVIKREIYTRPGGELDEDLLEEDRKRLLNLGIFSDVEFYVESNFDGSADIIVIVNERFRWLPFPAADYDELDGWSFGAGLYHRNFRGRNETLGMAGLFGDAVQYQLIFSNPWISGDHISLQAEFNRLKRYNKYEDFHETYQSYEAELGRKWGEYIWGRIKLGYLRIESEEIGITTTTEFRDDIPLLQTTFIYDSRDLYINPRRGYRFTCVTGQYGFPFKEPDYRAIQLTGSRYFPIPIGRTLAFGFLFGLKSGKTPVYFRYYLGGAETVRGLSENTAKGGRLLVLTSEYRFDIIKTFNLMNRIDFGMGGLLFIESGAVWDGWEVFGNQRFHSSYGAGLRFFVPIVEAVGLDYGWTFDGSSGYEIIFQAKI